jgi:ATP-dependent helicase/nuclease subunit B
MAGVRTEWVAFGPPASAALAREIREAKGDDPLTPVTVVVPTNQVGVGARRTLASGAAGAVCTRGSGVAAVTFLTVYRLGELLGSARLAGEGRRPVSSPVVGAALRAALGADPGIFGPVRDHPATETALVEAYRELRDLSEPALDAVAAQSRRARDVVRLHREAHRALGPSWYDEEDLLDAAAEVVGLGSTAVDGLGRVVVYLPQRITRHGASLLRTVAQSTDLVVLAGTCGDAAADEDTMRSVRRLADGEVEPAGGSDPLAMVDAERTRVVTVSDPDEEVRAGLRAIVEAVRTGTPLDRIAVLFADPEPYARVAYEQLTAAGLTVNGTSIMALTARVAARTLLGLLALPGGGFRRDDVFAWLAGARVLRRGRWVPATAWERLSRQAGVVGGRADWDALLERLAAEFDAKAEKAEGDPDAPDWRAERARREADQARSLRDFVLGLVDDLDRAASSPRRWPEWAEWARRHLDALLGGEPARADWPPAEQRAADRVDRALDRLGCLGEIEGPVTLDVFARTLELELDSDLGRVGRMGDGVLVAPVSMGVGLELDLVVVLGLAEGVFPSAPRDDSLLPDRERAVAGGELTLRSSFVERRHRELLAALAGATRHVLCVPRGDLRGSKERVPSRWVLQVAGALGGGTWYSGDLASAPDDHAWLERVASFDAGLRAVEFPATLQEYRLRALLSGAPAGSVDAEAAAGTEVVEQRRSTAFTRFDGNLAGTDVPSPVERTVSATRLERWANCPFAYLMRDVLGLEEVENPEEELTITPANRGSLVHQVLERFVAGVVDAPPAPNEAWGPSDEQRLVDITLAVFDEYEAKGLTGRAVFWRRERMRILSDLLRVLEDDSAYRRDHRTRPLAAELRFGFSDAAVDVVHLALADGRSVGFLGMADRVDVAEDGSLHVVDYKTGRADEFRALSEDDPDLNGTKLQLPVYGEAARASVGTPEARVRAEYWFTSSKGKFRRIGYDVTPDVLSRVGETLSVIVEGIESGVFPAYPRATSTTPWIVCPYCDPDGLGVADLRRSWNRKSGAPELAALRALAEPPDPAEGEAPGD